LAPITDTIPKPMVEFHGKPFLEYLVEMLRDQGFERILMLLGYLPDQIQEHFGDGGQWDVSIQYSVTPVDYETGRRIKLARELLDRTFLLMYCDNYWPMNFDSMWQRFTGSGASAQVTVYDNLDGYTRHNIRVGPEGLVEAYDPSRKLPGNEGVDIGFLILNDTVVDLMTDENASFEHTVYPQLVANRQLGAYVTGHRYYSVGSQDRLAETEKFLARQPVILLDRDGVLNKRMPRAKYVRSWEEWEWLPGAKEALRLYKEAGYRVIVISNQPGIAFGDLTEKGLADIHNRVRSEVLESGGEIAAIYHCPHGWDDGCRCRKPQPGLLFQAQREHSLDLSRTFFLGDDERDGQAAIAAGCPWAMVTEEHSLLYLTRSLLNGTLEKIGDRRCQNVS
jgi:D-glycero-D-manno-heptose 1,7-bisphosphate phosphatase